MRCYRVGKNKTMRPIIVIAGGGHAKVLINALKVLKKNIIGIIDPYKKDNILGVPIITKHEFMFSYNPEDIYLVNGLGMLPNKTERHEIFEYYKEQGYSFYSVIHPSVIIAEDVYLDEGVQLMAGAIIQPSVKIGKNSIVNTGSYIDHDSQIGEHCHIAPGVSICGGVSVADHVFIGAGTAVIQNICISRGSVVVAGDVVRSNIENIHYIDG